MNILNGKPFDPVTPPINIESVITSLPTGAGGAEQLWKLNHYYERLRLVRQPAAPHPTRPCPLPQNPSGDCRTSPSILRSDTTALMTSLRLSRP